MGSILGILGGGGSKKKKYILKNYSSCRINMSQREREGREECTVKEFFLGKGRYEGFKGS